MLAFATSERYPSILNRAYAPERAGARVGDDGYYLQLDASQASCPTSGCLVNKQLQSFTRPVIVGDFQACGCTVTSNKAEGARRHGQGEDDLRRTESSVTDRLRVGVIGCGVIAQVMHLVHLNELDSIYELVALCDLSETVLDACAARFGPAATYTDANEMLSNEELDVVMVLTAASHAPHAIAAANAGCHVFVEKPMCYSVEEGKAILEAVRNAGVRMIVGTHKRYDPAYERLLEFLPLDELPFVQSTTLQAPWQPHVHAYPIAYPSVPPLALAKLREEDDARLVAAYPDGTAELRYNYRWTLLDDLVHELNMLRGAIGEPTRVESADVSRSATLINLRFGDIVCHMSWLFAEEGMARYKQELAFVGMKQRVTISLPSPYLRAMPSLLIVEAGSKDTPANSRTVETLSYEEAFRRELVEFAAAINEDREPLTNGVDALHDIALCSAIADVHRTGQPIDNPSALPDWADDFLEAAPERAAM